MNKSAKEYLFTSESVSEGHPDKVADQISDAILDAILEQDPTARVAAETLCTTGTVMLAGEISTTANVDYTKIVRDTLKRIGYDDSSYGIDHKGCAVLVAYDKQSPDIAQGVDQSFEAQKGEAEDSYSEIGAGDQGMMFGYACNETAELMPLPIYAAHRLSERLTKVRKEGILPYLRPDGKTQVSVRYENDKPVGIDKIVVSTQHSEDIDPEQLREDIIEQVIAPVFADLDLSYEGAEIFINPTGRFVIGGPMGDAGLTGRKIIVDTYGGMGRHGGGAFSGKDCTKVDRSGAYAARWVAKNVVAAGLADRCEVQIAYAIGVARPVSIMIETFGTNHVPQEEIEAAVEKVFDLRPAAIIDALDLRRPIYRKTAAYGHFGRELPEFTWEHTNKVEDLKAACPSLS